MPAIRFNPAGYVTLNLGRRPEGPGRAGLLRAGRPRRRPPHAVDGYFGGPTDIAFDSDDNIYISDGYRNSRVAKFDKNGNWVTSWGTRGTGGPQANENPAQFNTPHNIGVDRQNNIYVADRNNRRIQVFDRDGKFQRFIFLNAAYDKKRHPVLGNLAADAPRPDAAVDDLHHQHADAVSLRLRRRAGTDLQDDARRQDPRHARRVRARVRSSSTGSTGSPARRRTSCSSPT